MSVNIRGFSGIEGEIEPNRALRTALVCRGDSYCVSAMTGTIAAALAANSSLFAMRLDPGAQGRIAFIERVRLQFTCLAAFTTPLTAGRRLELFRGTSTGEASGGTLIAEPVKKDTAFPSSEFADAQGGDVRVATTGALTAAVYTYETAAARSMSLSHVGNAGNFFEQVFEFSASDSAPMVLQPGQVLAVRNPVAMDAGGTFQLGIAVDWHEAAALA